MSTLLSVLSLEGFTFIDILLGNQGRAMMTDQARVLADDMAPTC